ncbi:TetR/AcrR family transcriptional regulator C-terminal domain-containing protein [Streptomyces globosus]|uniref:TetR/AcrR family transcriptional regulator C-terminal domain-containing protein n=1 Tax=Streptomyces globosus TaxID=68209 RepID=UPI0037F105D3
MTNTTHTTGEPPYRRIAADIRRRVADGALAPGDPVPSTRRLAADWGVALATATKALAVLRLEGVVEARPRIGTVVAGSAPAAPQPGRRPAAAPDPERELSLARIVRTAVAIADAEGLAALTMRAVAARLGVAPMSPYRHVPGKDDLVLLMADAAFGEASPPADAAGEWRPRLELGARTLWSVHRRHPWLAQVGPLTRPLLVPNLLAHSEWMLSALDGHGLDPATQFEINVLLYGHVQGLAVHLEREANAAAATGQSDGQWMDGRAADLAELLASDRFPTFAKVVGSFRDGYDLCLDSLFESGLKALLDGLAPVIEGRARSTGSN